MQAKMLDCGHKSGAAWGIARLVLNERNMLRRRNSSRFASFRFNSKYCYAFVIMHQFQQYVDSFSTITCRQNCSWDGKRWHCFLAVYVVSVWKKGQIFRLLHLYCLSMRKQQKWPVAMFFCKMLATAKKLALKGLEGICSNMRINIR